jgi:hypothetical protein
MSKGILRSPSTGKESIVFVHAAGSLQADSPLCSYLPGFAANRAHLRSRACPFAQHEAQEPFGMANASFKEFAAVQEPIGILQSH